MVLVLVTVRINAGLKSTGDQATGNQKELHAYCYEGGNQLKRE